MKYLNRKRILSILLTLFLAVMMTVPAMGLTHTQVPVNLGTALSFAVLAGSTITNTGTTNISGDAGGNVGLHPGTVFSGQASAVISGSVNLADAVALQAKNDLVIGYNDAIGRSPVTRISTELGGTTLTPGTYDSADGTFQITGTLTLDALGNPEAVFIFKTASTLITASASNIRLINGAVFCRVFWAVGSSATLGTTSHFVGHLMAMESITATTGATVQGQLLARNGAVTLDSNTITNGICLAPPVVVPPIVDPALDRRLPIYHGTNDYELVKGVGHFAQSVLPGEACNSVLSGHRDTVFRNLYNVEIGHRLIVETSAGIFTYEVNGIRIVHADDKTVIVPTGRAVLTLTTCYPFYAIGNAPDRYIVSAELVESLLKGDSP